MRLGSYPCYLEKDSLAYQLYKQEVVNERHRHRYEFNTMYRNTFIEHGMKLCGHSKNNTLIEMVECSDNAYYIGVQFHPEFKSRPLNPHPLFLGLIESVLKKGN